MSAKQKQFDTLNIEDVRVTVVLRSIFSGFKFEIESNDEKHFFFDFLLSLPTAKQNYNKSDSYEQTIFLHTTQLL